MKFTSYQKSAKPNIIANPNVRAATDMNAYGTNGNGINAVSEALNMAKQEYIRQKENEIVVKTTEASNEYSNKIDDLLNNEKSGLMYKELANTKNLTAEFQAAERKIRQETIGNVPRYEKAHYAFGQMCNKAAMQNMQNVRKHQYEQTEKHKGVVFETKINSIQDLAIKSQDPAQILAAIGESNTITASMYLNQKGMEAVNLLNREKNSALAENAIIQILSNGNAGDWQKADTVLNMTEKYVDPAKLSNLRSMVNKYQKADEKNILVKELRSKFGNDVTAAMNWLQNNNTTTTTTAGGESKYAALRPYMEANEGKKYTLGGDGSSNDGTDCGLTTLGGLQAMGWDISDRTADGQLHWAEQNGIFHADAAKAKPGDLVFIKNTTDRWTPTDDWETVANAPGSYAYKGVTHVGFMDENGDIWQAGSSGVKSVPKNAFEGKIVGYASTGGGGGETKSVSKYSAEEIKNLESMFIGELQREEQIKNFSNRQTIEGVGNQFLQMYQAGKTDIAEYEKIAATRSGGDDGVFRTLMGIARTYCNPSGIIGGQGGTKGNKFGLSVKPQLKELVTQGKFKTKQEFVDCVLRQEPSAAEFNEMMEEYDKWENGKGEYAYDWDSIKATAKAIANMDDDVLWEQTWHGTKEHVTAYINNYIKNNNSEPSYNEVIGAVKEAYVKRVYQEDTTPFYQFWGESNQVQYSAIELINAGIETARSLPDGNVAVYYTNGGEDTVSPSQLAEYIKQQRGELEADTGTNNMPPDQAAISDQEALDMSEEYRYGNFDNSNYSNTD